MNTVLLCFVGIRFESLINTFNIHKIGKELALFLKKYIYNTY